MIKSSISSAHFFYLIFIKSEKIHSIKELLLGFSEKKQSKKVFFDEDKTESYTHLQIEIPRPYGSPLVLLSNQSRVIAGRQAYWYDFYIGHFQDGKDSIYYMAYPYSKMGKYIENAISDVDRQATYSKLKLSTIVPFLKKMKKSNNDGSTINIIKYAGEVKEDDNRISIIGTKTNLGKNPLNSAVLKALEDKNIVVTPIALKLGYTAVDGKSIQLAFDRLGNYRFWLKTNGQEDVLPAIPKAYGFFKSSNTMEDSLYISSYNLLEENEQ